MKKQRYLIVNADDFGQSAGINKGIIETHQQGVVTSTSLMVRWPAALEATDYCRQNPNLSVGLHIDLSEWAYRNQTWVPLYQVVPPNDFLAQKAEISRQLAMFRRLVGKDGRQVEVAMSGNEGW